MNTRRTVEERSPAKPIGADPRSPGASRLAVRVGSGRPIAVLVVVSAALTALSLVGQLLVRSQAVQASWFVTLAAGFDLDHEVNVPSWFQTGLLLLCAAVLWTLADDVKERGLARSRYWRALCVVFLYLSLDELVSLHERVNVPLSSTLHLGGALTFSWVLLEIGRAHV